MDLVSELSGGNEETASAFEKYYESMGQMDQVNQQQLAQEREGVSTPTQAQAESKHNDGKPNLPRNTIEI